MSCSYRSQLGVRESNYYRRIIVSRGNEFAETSFVWPSLQGFSVDIRAINKSRYHK